MAEQMYLVVTIRKPVDTREQAEQLYGIVKQKLVDRPELQIEAHVTNHFEGVKPT